MTKAKTTTLALVLISALVLTFGIATWSGQQQIKQPNYEVYVLVHINDALKPDVVKSMLNQLESVSGIQLDIWVGDNNTSAIWDAKSRIASWISEFPNYNILIQCDYAFDQKYGFYQAPFWKYNSTETLSQEWYSNWYGNLSEVVNQYPNVKAMVGFNEPYNHFQTKEMAQTIMKREYLTWKQKSPIPFSTEFLMPYVYWADYWQFPQNPSVEEDCVPFWMNYSDYIGVNLWGDNHSPQLYTVGTLTFDRVKQTITMLEYYSEQLKKPILIDEYPAWDTQTFKYISDRIMQTPNIGQVYQLWFWRGQTGMYDSYAYGLFNVDPKTLQVTEAKAQLDVFRQVFKPP